MTWLSLKWKIWRFSYVIPLLRKQPDLFQDAESMIDWLTQKNIQLLPRQLDSNAGVIGKRMYNQSQVQWFDILYKIKTHGDLSTLLTGKTEKQLTEVGRACCGGRQICSDQNYKQRHFYVENKFPDWHCSVNHFFLYVKQVNGEVFVNKDCMMNFDGSVGPIGNLNESTQLLDKLKTQLQNNSLPVIQCKKHSCWCGLCAPKAQTMEKYTGIMQKYQRRIS